MNSNEKNQSRDQSSLQNGAGDDAAKKSSALLVILILLILSIVVVFGYMIYTAVREDAIDESIAAEQLKAENERANLTLDADGNVITQDALKSTDVLAVSDNVFLSKLSKSEPVSLLIIGDVIGTGAGAKDGTNWTNVLVSDIKDNFGSDANVNNLSLPSGNDSYSAFVTLMNESAGNPDVKYDAVIVTLGYYDDPFKFNLQYEGVLRAIKTRYPSAEIIGIIESASVTSPDGYSDETAIYARTLLDHYDGIVANMGEAFAVNNSNPALFTDDGILPNEKGQKLYSGWIIKQIKNKMSGNADKPSSDTASPSALTDKDGSIVPVNPDSIMYDHYYYIAENSFLRLDDTNYIIGVQDLTALGAETEGLLGLDYDLVNGPNTAQIVVDGDIFGALVSDFDGTAPERHITAVKNNAIITDHVAVSFATKAEADTFHGLILTGNINLSHAADKYKKLPLPPETPAETIAETVEETTAEESKAPESSAAETESSAPETKATEAESEAIAETRKNETKADAGNTVESSAETKTPETTAAETKETKKTKKQSSKSSSAKSNSSNEAAKAPETTAAPVTVETSTVTETSAVVIPETTAAPSQTESPAPETAAPETSAETQNYFENVIISDPSNSAKIFETTAPYTVEAGQGIDLSQWNLAGPTVG